MFGWFKKAPPALPMQLAPPPRRFNPEWSHTYVQRRQPDAGGARDYANVNLGLMEFTPIGAADHNRAQICAFQPPVMTAPQTVKMQGLGGLQAGQIIGQPLIDTDNLPYGGAIL